MPDADTSESGNVDGVVVGPRSGSGHCGCEEDVVSDGELLVRTPNGCFIRIFVDFSWCLLRMCIFNSAREVSVDVPILFLSFISVVPNTLNNRSHVAEFVQIERSRLARR